MHKREKCGFVGLLGLLTVITALFVGCAQQQKETKVQPSVEEIRGNSDRFFNKMEREEHAEPSP